MAPLARDDRSHGKGAPRGAARGGVVRLALCLALGVLAACNAAPGGPATGDPARDGPAADGGAGRAPSTTARAVPADLATPPPATLTADDKRAFTDAWRHFLDRSPLWPSRRRAWLARGGAADQVLAENLFRYFWAMSFQARADEVDRVAREASHVGAVAVPYFGRPLVVDSIPLKEPLRVKVEDPDDPKKSHFKMVSELQMDDITRRDAATVLGEIGEPAVPLLARDDVLVTGRPATRRHAARALGRIGSDAAVDALVAVLVRGTDWQDRAAIVAGLGAALPHPRARAALEQARQDSDPFVRRKAEEALAR